MLETIDALAEIRRLLAEAYEHYFQHSDGHAKSAEGAISLHWPAYFWNQDDGDEVPGPQVEIFSYVFAPHGRRAHFDSLDEALKAVRGWHAEELATVYCTGCLLPTRVEGDCMCHLDL